MFDLTISITTRDNKQQLKECLESIYQYNKELSLEIYVVNDCSTDDTEKMILELFPQVKSISNKRQMGFSYNHNRVLKIAKGKYVIILNDDTLILEGTFKKMIAYLDNHPDVGVMGPKTLNKDYSYQQCAFKNPSLGDIFSDFFFSKIRPGNRLSALYRNIESVGAPKEVDWLLGACFMFPRAIIERVGLLDEGFHPVYLEDADFCKRIKDTGYKIIYFPQAKIIHYGAQTTQKQKELMRKILYKNRLRFFSKHYGIISYLLARLVLCLGGICNILFDAIRYLTGRITGDELFKNIKEYFSIAAVR